MATKLLTMAETAERLNRSVRQLEWMVYSGTAPRSAKIAGRRLFKESDIEAFIDAAFAAEDARISA